MKDYIRSANEDRILDIKIERPNKKNALTEKMYLELNRLISNASKSTQINVILISGGQDFTAGNDLEDFKKNPPQDRSSPVFKFMQSFSKCPLPIIASVDGFAVGIGTTMLLHSDLVYASKDSVFMLPFIDLGVVPEFGSSMLLPERLGYVKAAEMLMLGNRITAEEALQMGLINLVFRKDEVYEAAKKIARAIGSTVPNEYAIHLGGSCLTESITQPTRTGGIKSRTLLDKLAKHDQLKYLQSVLM